MSHHADSYKYTADAEHLLKQRVEVGAITEKEAKEVLEHVRVLEDILIRTPVLRKDREGQLAELVEKIVELGR